MKSSNSGNVEPVTDQTPATDKTKGEKTGSGTTENSAKKPLQVDQGGTPGGATTEKQPEDHAQDANQGDGKKPGGLPEFLDPNRNKRERTPVKREAGGAGGERIVPPRSTVDPAKIAGSIKLGDFYLSRGEYDNAINEFQKGLSLEPSNAQLRERLERARKAKAAESRVLN